jgi:trimethylamine--corrinoid protein Co-methyltransferase
MRQEYFDGNGVTDAKSRDNWEKEGSQDAFARARELVRTLLAKEAKSYISKEIDQAIREKFDILL